MDTDVAWRFLDWMRARTCLRGPQTPEICGMSLPLSKQHTRTMYPPSQQNSSIPNTCAFPWRHWRSNLPQFLALCMRLLNTCPFPWRSNLPHNLVRLFLFPIMCIIRHLGLMSMAFSIYVFQIKQISKAIHPTGKSGKHVAGDTVAPGTSDQGHITRTKITLYFFCSRTIDKGIFSGWRNVCINYDTRRISTTVTNGPVFGTFINNQSRTRTTEKSSSPVLFAGTDRDECHGHGQVTGD